MSAGRAFRLTGSGVVCVAGMMLSPIWFCTVAQQAACVAQAGEQTEQQGSDGGFAVGTGYAYQFQLMGRVVVEVTCHYASGLVAVGDLYITNIRRNSVRHGFADNGGSSLANGPGDEVVPVCREAADGNKHRPA